MKARVNYNGQLSDEIAVDNGVKQGDIPAPTLFSLYLTAVLWYAFQDCDVGVYFRFRTSGKVFNLRRFQAKTLVHESLVRELLYADDADLVAHSAEEMQIVMDRFADACTRFGLTISLDKTKVMCTPAPGDTSEEPDIYVYGHRLEVVEHFVYLGSKISNDGSLDAEIKDRISKAAVAFGSLEDRVWSDKDLTLNTKLDVYKTCVLSSLLYASETWTTYQSHIKLLERFHQHSLRHILKIEWQSYTPDTVVYSRAGMESVSVMVVKNQMRWAGHLVRMDDTRLPKRLFYGELSSGKRPQHKPRKRFRDSVKGNLKYLKIAEDSWETLSKERTEWRKRVFEGGIEYESGCKTHAEVKRACRKQEPLPEGCGPVWNCEVCGRVLLSKAGLVNHLKSHEPRRSRYIPETPIDPPSDNPGVHMCNVCTKICKSSGGLKLHMKIHATHHRGDEVTVPATHGTSLECWICSKQCKSRAGLKSHLRAHGRSERNVEEEGMALV